MIYNPENNIYFDDYKSFSRFLLIPVEQGRRLFDIFCNCSYPQKYKGLTFTYREDTRYNYIIARNFADIDMLETEIWKCIYSSVGNYYYLSSFGRVLHILYRNNKIFKLGFLKPQIYGSEVCQFPCITITDGYKEDGKPYRFTLHIANMLGKCFLKNSNNFHYIRYKNGNKYDYRLNNLYWGSYRRDDEPAI